MENDDPWKDPSPWHPIKDPVDLKHLGKLVEEAGELTSAAARCTIQGMDEAHPVTGKINRDWLADEVADVLANLELNIEHFDLDMDVINTRKERKKRHLRAWHAKA